jgi:hypothetical protein
LASSSSPTFARMIFCSVVMMVSSNRRGGALRHPDRSAPRLGLRFAVGNQDTDVRLSFS